MSRAAPARCRREGMGKSGARLSSPARTAGMDTSVTPGSGEQNDKLDDAFRFIAAHPYVRKIGRRGITKNEGEEKGVMLFVWKASRR